MKVALTDLGQMSYAAFAMASLALASLLTSCGAGGINIEVLSPSPPTIMVSKRSPLTLYIVSDPARVKPLYNVPRIGELTGMPTFVSRDLKQVMSEYFVTVEIVSKASEITAERYMLADVKVDQITKGLPYPTETRTTNSARRAASIRVNHRSTLPETRCMTLIHIGPYSEI